MVPESNGKTPAFGVAVQPYDEPGLVPAPGAVPPGLVPEEPPPARGVRHLAEVVGAWQSLVVIAILLLGAGGTATLFLQGFATKADLAQSVDDRVAAVRSDISELRELIEEERQERAAILRRLETSEAGTRAEIKLVSDRTQKIAEDVAKINGTLERGRQYGR